MDLVTKYIVDIFIVMVLLGIVSTILIMIIIGFRKLHSERKNNDLEQKEKVIYIKCEGKIEYLKILADKIISMEKSSLAVIGFGFAYTSILFGALISAKGNQTITFNIFYNLCIIPWIVLVAIYFQFWIFTKQYKIRYEKIIKGEEDVNFSLDVSGEYRKSLREKLSDFSHESIQNIFALGMLESITVLLLLSCLFLA